MGALLAMRRYGEAAAEARSGLATWPDDPRLVLLLAMALSSSADGGKKQLQEAVDVATQAVAMAPDDAAAHRTLGWAYLRRRHPGQALQHFKQAVSLDPLDPSAHEGWAAMALGAAFQARGVKRFRDRWLAEAEEHAAEVTRLCPTAAAGPLLYARAALLRRDATEAETWVLRALAAEPTNPEAHRVFGQVAQVRGETGQAAAHFVDSGKLDPRQRAPLRALRGMRAGRVDVSGRAHPVEELKLFAKVAATLVMATLLLVVLGAEGGPAVAIGSWAAVVAFLYLQVVQPRRMARRLMADEARGVLERDRQLRPRGWRPFRR